ncbi:aa146949-21a9-4667-8181-d3948aef2746 [Thermothielavioides terrestris]|uniref:Fumarylacetoacetase n=1 Tax=Thermothielavioides terrestris TaxID=2587410 RepID=A0A3S4F608_9PEZI|nr:aa146949-21a9-4667-8181-d3948aef2746 [Thermothielavioides terrestris]
MASPEYAHHFSDRNVPFGIASSKKHPEPRAVTRLGNSVIFLHDCLTSGLFEGINGLPGEVFANDTLNQFAALPKLVQRSVRQVIQDQYRKRGDVSSFPPGSVEDITEVQMHMPVSVGDFADFSCSLAHVKNAGRIIINDARPPPAFFNMPIAYQGRASSVVVSSTDIERPMGQYRDKTAPAIANEPPPVVYGPSRAVDYELEFAAIVGKPLPMRQRLNAVDADEHIFGFVILNDWSARDIQGLEMAPLGPFNGKNFGTTISPWVVTLDALEPFQTTGPPPAVAIPPHLQDPSLRTYAVRMQAEILAGNDDGGSEATVAGTSWVQDMYWSARQMLAHAASAGSALRTGDIMATGTVSGDGEDARGCMLELTEGGTRPFRLRDGSERRFLQDGDVVRMTAVAGGEQSGVGFGECVGRLVASRPF